MTAPLHKSSTQLSFVESQESVGEKEMIHAPPRMMQWVAPKMALKTQMLVTKMMENQVL
jgi:hypothetical protein